MANPPITIGSFDNVPAPGSPIKSDWAQEISTYVQALPRGRIADAVSPGSDQAIATNATTDLSALSVAFTATNGRFYKTSLYVVVSTSANGAGVFNVNIATGAGAVIKQGLLNLVNNTGVVLTMFAVEWGISGAQTRKAQVVTSFQAAGGLSSILNTGQRNAVLIVEDMGAALPAVLLDALDRVEALPAGDEAEPRV